MNKTALTVIGFILLIIGFTAFILGLVGVRLQFLAFLDTLGVGASILSKLIMILVGFVLIYIGKTPDEREA